MAHHNAHQNNWKRIQMRVKCAQRANCFVIYKVNDTVKSLQACFTVYFYLLIFRSSKKSISFETGDQSLVLLTKTSLCCRQAYEFSFLFISIHNVFLDSLNWTYSKDSPKANDLNNANMFMILLCDASNNISVCKLNAPSATFKISILGLIKLEFGK